MESPRRTVRWLVLVVMTGLLPACAASRSGDVAPTTAPSQGTGLDPRHGITVDQFSGFPIRGGGTR